MRLQLLTPPAVEPVTLAEAKAHLRVETAAEDALIASLIAAARQDAESFTGRAFIHQSWRLTLDVWHGETLPWWDGVREGADVAVLGGIVALPRPPLAAVTQVRTYSAGGTASVVSSAVYLVDPSGVPGRLILHDGQSWPLPGRSRAGIEIDFVAGYGAAASAVPQAIRTGILVEVARLYEHRGDGGPVPDARLLPSLWHPYRVMGV